MRKLSKVTTGFVVSVCIFLAFETDTNADTDTDKATDTDTGKDTEKDTGKDTDTEKDTGSGSEKRSEIFNGLVSCGGLHRPEYCQLTSE